MLARSLSSPVWAEVAEKCLACGTCTYNCPDAIASTSRIACWPRRRARARLGFVHVSHFTQHASGHNPRPDQAARWRQRTMHKFEYLPRNVGLYGCVGCGRCMQSCPVRLDIRDVLRRVREAHAAQGAKPSSRRSVREQK